MGLKSEVLYELTDAGGSGAGFSRAGRSMHAVADHNALQAPLISLKRNNREEMCTRKFTRIPISRRFALVWEKREPPLSTEGIVGQQTKT